MSEGNQSRRIAFLKDALKNLAKSVNEVSRGLIDLEKIISRISGKTREFAKEQNTAAQTMNRVGKNLKQTSKDVENYGNKTEKASKSQKGFFSGMARNLKTIVSFYGAYTVLNTVVSAVSDVFVGGMKRAIALEKSLADLRAVAGLTADEVDRMRMVVFDVAGVTSLTAKEVVSLQKELAKLGSSVDEIEGLTRPIALLSQALGEDAGGVAATLKKTLNQFQATSEEAEKFANILTGAVNETALSMNDLGTALGYVGPLGSQLGVSFEETAALLGILADNGFKASKAGTGLRSFFIAAAKDGRPFNEFLEDIGSTSLTATEAVEIFGKVAASQVLVLSKNVDKYKDLSESLKESDRLFKANAAQMSSTQGQLDLLSSAYDKFSTRIGDSITKTNMFINLIAVLDKEAAGLAGAYRILSKETERTNKVTGELIESFRMFGEGADSPISDADALAKAMMLVAQEGEFAKSTVDDTFSLLNFYLEQGKDLQEAFAIASEKTGRGQLRLLTTTRELVDLLYQQSKGIDEAFISQEANNESIRNYKREYNGLLSLTREGLSVDKEKQKLQVQINSDTVEYANELNNLRTKNGPLTRDEEERAKILEKRIALLKDLSLEINGLSVSEETLADKRKKADKEAQKSFETDLASYIKRIEETEKAIADLPEGVSDKVFTQQVDLLTGFFGSAEDIIAQATERFGADSPFVKALIETLKKASEKVNVEIPKDPFADVILDTSALEAFDEGDVEGVTKVAKKTAEKIRDAFKEVKLAEVIAEGLDKAAESISAFNDTALENTRNRLESEKSAIENRYEIENDILKSELDNQLITESQFRQKKLQFQKAQLAEENAIDQKIFEAEKKRDKQNATTDYLQSLASIIPNLIIYDKEGNPVKLATKYAISAGLTTAAYGAELAAISQRKFFPKKFEQGGMVSGPSHAEGGVPFTVQGQSGYEMEGGEFIVNKKATAMHRDLLERINGSYNTKLVSSQMKFADGGIVQNQTLSPNIKLINNQAPQKVVVETNNSEPMKVVVEKESNESVNYLKAIAEATTSTAIGVSKPVRAYVADADLRSNANERRIRDRNDRI